MKFNVTNVLLDGTELESMKGIVIPRTETTDAFYKMIEEETKHAQVISDTVPDTKQLA